MDSKFYMYKRGSLREKHYNFMLLLIHELILYTWFV